MRRNPLVLAVTLTLARSSDHVLDERGRLAGALPHPPVSVIVFGSFARREAGVDSDIDVVFVRPAGVDEDEWSASLEAWRRDTQRLTGTGVEVLEVGADEAAVKLRSRSPVWADIRRDGRVVHGLGLDELRAAHSA